MSRPILPFDLPLERLRIVRWPDPVVDATGHDLRSTYVERFWLPVLGPSTTWLARRIAADLDQSATVRERATAELERIDAGGSITAGHELLSWIDRLCRRVNGADARPARSAGRARFVDLDSAIPVW